MNYMLYGKGPNDKQFRPMNYKTGERVMNRINASMFCSEQAEGIRGDLPALHADNPGWKFELRKCG